MKEIISDFSNLNLNKLEGFFIMSSTMKQSSLKELTLRLVKCTVYSELFPDYGTLEMSFPPTDKDIDEIGVNINPMLLETEGRKSHKIDEQSFDYNINPLSAFNNLKEKEPEPLLTMVHECIINKSIKNEDLSSYN